MHPIKEELGSDVNVQKGSAVLSFFVLFDFLRCFQSEDVRLDPVISEACSKDIRKYCRDVSYGQAKVRTCEFNQVDWFSNDCRKSNTKVITPAINRSEQRDEPIRIPRNYL